MPAIDLRDIDTQQGNVESQAPVPMVRTDGALVMVSNPQTALELGYKHASQAQVAQMQKAEADRAEFGDSPLRAGAAGVARGATFGLSDFALSKTGLVNSGTLESLERYNPGASTAGEVVGAVGSTLLAPEFSLPGLSERGAVKLATRATAGMAEGAAKKIAAKALGDAVQGAAYGAGNLLSEQSLGNKDLTAEQVMGTVGIGTLLGGGIGGGLTGLGIVAKKTAAAAKIPDILEKAVGARFSRISGYLSDKDPKEIQTLFENRMKATISEEERQQVQDQIVQHVIDQDKALTEFSQTTAMARPQQRETLLRDQFGAQATEQQVDSLSNISNSIQLSIQKMRAEPEIYTKVGAIRQLEHIATGIDSNLDALVKRPENLYAYADKVKQKIDDLARFGKNIPDSEQDTVREVKRLRTQLKKSLEDSNVWGVTGERQEEFNAATSRWLTAQKQFYRKYATKTFDDAGNVAYRIDSNKMHVWLHNLELSKNSTKDDILSNYLAKGNAYIDAAKQVHVDVGTNVPTPSLGMPQEHMETLEFNNLFRRLKSVYRNTGTRESVLSPQAVQNVGLSAATGHPLYAAAAGLHSILSNPVSTIEKIVSIEKAKAKAVQTFTKGVDAFLEGKATSIGTILATDIAGTTHLLSKRESEDTSAEVAKKRIAEVQHLAQNADVLNDRIAQTTGGLQGVDQINTSLQGKLSTAVAYLNANAPKDPNAGSITKKNWQPKPSEVMKFNRHLAAVQSPYSVLANPTAEGIDTIKNVYPSIYAEMQKRVMFSIADKDNEKIPYQTKLKLQRVFGLSLDRLGNGADLQRLQATYSQGGQNQNIKRSSRQMQTASQSQTGSERLEEKLP